MPESSDQSERIRQAADDLAAAILEETEGRGYTALETRFEVARHLNTLLTGGDQVHPITAIESKIDHAGYLLRRLVSVTGFQAELVVYGGDYEERGTSVHRDCRISIRREEFDAEHLKALTAFADEHGCKLTISKHGATLRPKGNHLTITQHDGLQVNSLTTGAAAGSGNSANTAAAGVGDS